MTSTTTPFPKNPAAENVLGDIGLASTSSIGASGFNIYGSADSAAKLVAMARARRSEKDSELKVNKTVPVLTGTKDFVTWRMMLLGLFVPYLGGRYWHLLQKDPSTSVEAYRIIFAPSDDKPIDREEAAAHRSADLIAVHGLLLQTLHVDVLQSVNEETSSGNFDGGRLWDALSAKYAGKDLGSKRAAENAIKDFKLGALTVTEAAQQLQSLFTQVYLATGGRAVLEDVKIEAALTTFNTPRFQSLRTAIQEAWQNGTHYTFDQVIGRFAGEESLTAGMHPVLGKEDGARALQTQVGRAATNPPRHQSGPGSNRPNPQRRQEGNTGRGTGSTMTCWHCTKSGHRMQACRRRLAGEPPHPNSHLARERANQAPHSPRHMSTAPDMTAATFSRLASIEATLHRALMSIGDRRLTDPSFGPSQHQPPHYTMPSLAHRISERQEPDHTQLPYFGRPQ